MSKELCDCGKKAVWTYMPGYSIYCDDCVPRGCECNYYRHDRPHPEGKKNVDWKWIEKGKTYTYIDDRGREYPCSEYMFNSDGWEREINPHI